MNPNKQRIAIAKACPNIHDFGSYLPSKDEWGTDVWNPVWRYFNGRQWIDCLNNDPLSDLNAMHEAEKTLTARHRTVFEIEVLRITTGKEKFDYDRGDLIAVITATASQRAEAFLRTLNLWQDE